ncbi:hypothetical protein GCM10012275_42600 [Longimycelium tulufanense]|uniref:DUF1173 family protein n=1 Tax=Longimycelium tulufanense TaxID=907463 RepID=A0A8J3CEJ3_9PSEU|nr:hypothetical protein GCM10012275_42600 [Longimycelium tulufanense]
MRLAGRVVPLAALRAHPGRFVSLFGKARAEVGHAECLCDPDRPQRLVIRCRAGRYHLAGWPEQGHLHATTCPWYRTDPALSGSASYPREAITSTDSGTAIRLAVPLRTRSAAAPPVSAGRADTPSHATRGTSRRALGLLALLHWLWEQARLSLWHPRAPRRTWGICHARLSRQAGECVVNRLPLASVLYVVPPYRPATGARHAADFEAFTARLSGEGSQRRRGLVLGEIRRVEPTPYGVRIGLAHLRAPLFASRALHERLRRSHRTAFAGHSNKHGGRQVVLCLVDRHPGNGYLVIEDAVVMLCSATYIPVESSYELRMSEALTAAGRAFLKPLRYDGTGVFPDFVLLDTTPHTYVEVWGIRGREDYEQRKRIKQAHYRGAGHPLLEWAVHDPLPDVLPRGRRPPATLPPG